MLNLSEQIVSLPHAKKYGPLQKVVSLSLREEPLPLGFTVELGNTH